MWTPASRRRYSREHQRYESDLTDAEWRLIEPHLPPPSEQGRPRSWPWREIVTAIFCVLRSGCPWRLLPKDFPPWRTVYRRFRAWRDTGRFATINHALVMADRGRAGREPSPTGAILDSQSVKTTESGGPRGYDAGKRVKGRKRPALVGTDGRALVLVPHEAGVQDRDGAVQLLKASRTLFPWIERVFAGGAYTGDTVATATRIVVEVVKKCPDQVGFAVHPRGWVVERFFAWLGRSRRLAKDFGATIASATAFLHAASVILLARRIARSG